MSFGDSVLARRHLVPPFDVLDGRADDWKQRRRLWNELGLGNSHLGRMGADGWNETALANGLGDWLERVDNDGARTDFAHGCKQHRVSVFCPALAEVLIRWFSEPGGLVFDPFSGGSVRGLVAAHMGRDYFGVDLRDEQIDENRKQAAAHDTAGNAQWFQWDGTKPQHAAMVRDAAASADLLLTCPPYGTLERYSDHPDDLSTMRWGKFRTKIEATIADYCAIMKRGAHMAIVVADYREKHRGNYTALRPLVATVCNAVATNADLVASCVYLTPLGTLPIRAAHNWEKGGKLGRAHQNVIVGRAR